jgi:hypothetical protein
MGAAPKMITQNGEPVVHFDLDAVDDEANEVPFTFALGGEVFTMAGPEDADWQVQDDLAASGAGLKTLMRDLLGEDDYERFVKHKVSGRKLGRLLEACRKHYGITPPESRASARS